MATRLFIVFDDADLDVAVDGRDALQFRNAGQTCICANRSSSRTAIYDEFARALTAAAVELTVGSGFEAGVEIGPLIDGPAVGRSRARRGCRRPRRRLVAGG